MGTISDVAIILQTALHLFAIVLAVYNYWRSKDRARKESCQDTALNYQGNGRHAVDHVALTERLASIVAHGEDALGA